MAATDYHLKFEGPAIKGDSDVKGFEGQIKLESFSWGCAHAGSFTEGTGGARGRTTAQDVHAVALMSKASPLLMQNCANGQHFDKVTVTAQKAGGSSAVSYMIITLEKALISSYNVGGSASSTIPTDQFSLNFAKIKYEYKDQDNKGAGGSGGQGTYDFQKNTV